MAAFFKMLTRIGELSNFPRPHELVSPTFKIETKRIKYFFLTLRQIKTKISADSFPTQKYIFLYRDGDFK